ncbi:MAG: peptide ABC transporter substrate-binding protein [Chlamydiia bacterium]|nr:peptide ABC transporter substrate-binding protein [Chlamydiia bacterium]
MGKKITFLSLTIFALFLSLLIYSQKQSKPPKKNVLKISLPSDVSTLHMAFNRSASIINSSHVMNLLFEGLMRKDKNDVPREAVAERVEISNDGKQITFYLRETKWSDGAPVTAHDFEYAWKRGIDPHSKNLIPSPYYYYPIKNAKRCIDGEVSIDLVGIKAIDHKTLRVDLEYPSPYFLEIVSTPMFFPAPKHIAKENPRWALGPKIVCNGPFTLETWRQNQDLFLSKNHAYWDANHVYLDGVDVAIIPDSRTALSLFIKKELDWLGSPFYGISYDISYDLIDDWTEDAITVCILMNTQKYPLNHKKLRQALSYAIDREAITDNVFHFSATPSSSILPIPMRVTKKSCFQSDPILAKTLFLEVLEELGTSLKEFPEIELNYLADIEIASRIAQAVQDQWRKVFGINKFSLVPYEYNTYFDLLTRGDYALGLTNWTSFVFDPIFILNDFKYQSLPMNKTNWEHPHYQTLLDQSDLTLEKPIRQALLIKAEAFLMDEMPVIPICSLKKRFAKNPKLHGEVLSKLQFVDFKSAYFRE